MIAQVFIGTTFGVPVVPPVRRMRPVLSAGLIKPGEGWAPFTSSSNLKRPQLPGTAAACATLKPFVNAAFCTSRESTPSKVITRSGLSCSNANAKSFSL